MGSSLCVLGFCKNYYPLKKIFLQQLQQQKILSFNLQLVQDQHLQYLDAKSESK